MAVRIQQADFDTGAELERLTAGRTGAGAVVSFLGLVRDLAGDRPADGSGGGSDDGPVRAMTLEHYPGMTERMLAEVEAEARARWPVEDSLIVHRVGRLEPGDRIVLVAVASAHRHAAFEACAFLIDWLKTRAPFWKREETDRGDRWVEARAADDAAAARWASGAAPADAPSGYSAASLTGTARRTSAP